MRVSQLRADRLDSGTRPTLMSPKWRPQIDSKRKQFDICTCRPPVWAPELAEENKFFYLFDHNSIVPPAGRNTLDASGAALGGLGRLKSEWTLRGRSRTAAK